MNTKPLSTIDVLQATAKHQNYSGKIKIDQLKRLCDLLADASGAIDYRLQFAIDANANKIATGYIKTTCHLACQRCLKPMAMTLDLLVKWCFMTNESEIDLPPTGFEALEMSDNHVQLADLITDEVLLSLPIAPRHLANECEMPETSEAKAEGSINKMQAAFNKLKRN